MTEKRPYRILLVEDDRAHVAAIERAFQRAGSAVELTVAESVTEAAAAYQNSEQDLVVSDLMLPDGQGIDLLQHAEDPSRVPFMLMTSYGNEETAVKALKAGAIDYVVKSKEAFRDMPRRAQRAIEQWRMAEAKHAAEMELRASEERFRAIFEHSPDMVCIKNRDLIIEHGNQSMADAFGKRPEELIGLTAHDLFDTAVAEQLEELDRQALQGRTTESEHSRDIQGRKHVFVDTRVPLRGGNAGVEGICMLSHDITHRARYERTANITSDDCQSPAMSKMMEEARLAAASGGTVLLQGESGTGKDYVAKWIHDHSPRHNGPYFALNCAALSPQLAESELFGHERGAFTGAQSRKKGMVELAEGGTLLLNEIAELPLSLQSKLLTFLDTKKFVRVGGERETRVNVRILAATHRVLQTEIAEGRFLEALYYRLAVLTLRVPSLRDRVEDLPGLTVRLIHIVKENLGITQDLDLAQESLHALSRYQWPGNVRELRNLIERALMLWSNGPLQLELPGAPAPGPSAAATPGTDNPRLDTVADQGTLREALDETIRRMCVEKLRQHGGNKKQAAKAMGISRDALYRYIRRFEI